MTEPVTDPISDEAPYGYLKDGVTPRRKPGPPKGSRPEPGSPRKKNRPNTKTNKSPTDYTEGIMGLLALPAGLLAFAGRATGNRKHAAASVTIMSKGQPWATALNDTAQEDPRIAQVLDRVIQVGPYGALITSTVMLGWQIAAVYDRAPVVSEMGIQSADEILDEFTRAHQQPSSNGHRVTEPVG